MNTRSASTQESVNSDVHHASSTHLQGRRLALLRLAWVVLSILALLLFLLSLPVYVASQQTSYTTGYAVFLLTLNILVALVWFIVAVLIFWRKSDDWMALLVSLMLVFQGASITIDPLNLIPSVWQAPAEILALLAFFLLFLVFCLFPTGRFVPRWIVWLALLFLGWEVLQDLNILPQSYDNLYPLALYGFLGGLVVSLIYRYRSVSSRSERQQTKWIVYGVTVTYLIELAITVCYGFFPSFFSPGSLGDLVFTPLGNCLPILIPLSFGFAMLRSRLWEIDNVINRTLVYGTVTALLALVYFVGVIGLQAFFHGFTGGNQLAIVGTTLVIAALFQPLRQRMQQTIDRRFYRRKYDAARTLAAFSVTLRDEMDLTELSKQLLAVVQETMQPTHVSLWLRHAETSRGRNTRLLPRIDEEERVLS